VTYDGRGLTFGTVAENYDRYRSDTPAEAAELFGDLSGLKVLDVGAGTGKLTRFLVGLGAEISVVEPDDDMRRVLMRQSPGVHELIGSAEEIPVADAAFDVVASSSAWHWFRQPETTIEMSRILRDDGRLFVLWNGFSRDVEWARDLMKLRNQATDANARPRGWSATLDLDGDFVDVRDFSIDWTWPRTIDQVVALFGTYSGAIIQSDENKSRLSDIIRGRLQEIVGDPKAQGDVTVDIPMTLRGTTARRQPR
jgi:SAM-dependent methyltransferase